MAHVLRQSTGLVIRVGPFVDATDGVTPETGITLGAADQAEILKAAGAATADISAATWAAVTGADGWYNLTLTTSHTDTIGELVIVIQDSSVCLPVFVRCQVIEEAVYDAMYAASATPITLAQINAEVDTALADIGLDHLVSVAVVGSDVVDNSIVAKLVSASATADWDDFVNTTDSLQALRDLDGSSYTAIPKTGYSLSATGLDLVVLAEPAAAPAWTTGTIVEFIAWSASVQGRNKKIVVESPADTFTETVRNDSDSGDLYSRTIVISGGNTATKSEFS